MDGMIPLLYSFFGPVTARREKYVVGDWTGIIDGDHNDIYLQRVTSSNADRGPPKPWTSERNYRPVVLSELWHHVHLAVRGM